MDFKVDVIVVIGDDRLHSQMEGLALAQQQRKPVVIKLSKSGGVITRSAATRHAGQSSRIREYFYGTNKELCPHSSVLDLSAIQVRLLQASCFHKVCNICMSGACHSTPHRCST